MGMGTCGLVVLVRDASSVEDADVFHEDGDVTLAGVKGFRVVVAAWWLVSGFNGEYSGMSILLLACLPVAGVFSADLEHGVVEPLADDHVLPEALAPSTRI